MTKISQTKIGQSVVELANQVAKAAEVAKVDNKTQVQTGGDKFAAGGQSSVQQLKAKLDEVRNLLGQEAVNEILGDLPKAAVDALKSINGDLKIEAGQSPYLAYKKAYGELLKLEGKVHATYSALSKAAERGICHSDNSGWDDGGKHLVTMQKFKTRADLDEANPNATSSQRDKWVAEARSTVNWVNKVILEVFPEAPPSYLAAGPFMEGPGKMSAGEMRNFSKGWGGEVPGKGPSKDLEVLRSLVTGYADTAKQVAQLEVHLRDKAFPSAKEIALLKAELHDDSVSVKDLFTEAKTLIAELEGMADKSEIKREVLKGTGKSESYGESTSFKDAGPVMVGVGMTAGYSVSQSSSTAETLNVTARAYTMLQTPSDMRNFKVAEYAGHNTISPLETSILMERLLTVRRLYEAMQTREPESSFTGALKGWMEESTFDIQGAGKLKMSDLRADLISLSESGAYPKERIDLVKEELNLGPSRVKGKLSGLKSLSDL